MRELNNIFTRNLLTQDVARYNDIVSKSVVLGDDDVVTNILEELEDGSEFIKGGIRYFKSDGKLYKPGVEGNEIKYKEIELKEII